MAAQTEKIYDPLIPKDRDQMLWLLRLGLRFKWKEKGAGNRFLANRIWPHPNKTLEDLNDDIVWLQTDVGREKYLFRLHKP